MTSGKGSEGRRRAVIKIGGSSVSTQQKLDAFALEIARLVRNGFCPLIVHGGGPEISEEMKLRGLPVKKVAGLRVTDKPTLRIAIEVLSNINARIVKALRNEGVDAVGMMGAEGGTIKCVKMPPAKTVNSSGEAVEVDLGFVGEVVAIDPSVLTRQLAMNEVPVMFPICSLGDGALANVNADTAAAHLAASLKAEQLVLVTDVPGLMLELGNLDTIIPVLRTTEIDGLIQRGILGEGMIPKVEACRFAVEHGVRVAHMIDASSPGAIAEQLMGVKLAGTRVVCDKEVSG